MTGNFYHRTWFVQTNIVWLPYSGTETDSAVSSLLLSIVGILSLSLSSTLMYINQKNANFHHTWRVPEQNGVSVLYIMIEIHHSGQEPSIYNQLGLT